MNSPPTQSRKLSMHVIAVIIALNIAWKWVILINKASPLRYDQGCVIFLLPVYQHSSSFIQLELGIRFIRQASLLFQIFSCLMSDLSWQFHENLLIRFPVMSEKTNGRTERQTDRLTDKPTEIKILPSPKVKIRSESIMEALRLIEYVHFSLCRRYLLLYKSCIYLYYFQFVFS